MADKIATYAFIEKEGYEAAKELVKKEFGNYGWDTGTTNDYWLLHILSDCDNPSRAAQIYSANGGKPY
jgi:hypothetical protein